jgi:hypothetical protein
MARASCWRARARQNPQLPLHVISKEASKEILVLGRVSHLLPMAVSQHLTFIRSVTAMQDMEREVYHIFIPC